MTFGHGHVAVARSDECESLNDRARQLSEMTRPRVAAIRTLETTDMLGVSC